MTVNLLKKFLTLTFPLLIFISCQTTTTYWIPVYSLQYDVTTEEAGFDPRINAVINPEEGLLLAYYETTTKKGTVYGNDYSMSLAEKVVIKNNEIVSEKSTPKSVTNLELYKSFYFNYFKETAEDRKLYIVRNDTLIALDHSEISNEQVITYIIMGKNVGTNGISEILITDILPAGFEFEGSEYSVDSEIGAFEHKVIAKNSRTAIVLVSRFKRPLQPAETFSLRINLIARFDKMEEEFSF
jgi:uncharacterized repeat protein (TIGR01451 family)